MFETSGGTRAADPVTGVEATGGPVVDVSGRPDMAAAEALLDVIGACEREVAALQARQVAAVAALARVRAGTALEEFVADEVGLALTLSPSAARGRVEVARALAERLPATLSMLADGRLDYYRARCVVEALDGLNPALASAVEERVLPGAAGSTATQLKAALRRAVLALDPAGSERRHARARAGRGVGFTPLDDGMAWLSITAPADAATLIYTALDGLARGARGRPGEERTLDQLRVDALTGIARDVLAAGSWRGVAIPAGRRRAHLHVTVGADTLLGVGEEPGWLAGYGAIPASMAREVARDATWQRLLTDPVRGSLLEMSSTAHDPGVVLEAHVLTRDQTCTWTTCTAPATGCDVDHTVPWPSGPTDPTNLGPVCRHHHRAKQAGFQVTQPTPGTFVWTTPNRRTHTRRPPALAPPRPDHREKRRPSPGHAHQLRGHAHQPGRAGDDPVPSWGVLRLAA